MSGDLHMIATGRGLAERFPYFEGQPTKLGEHAPAPDSPCIGEFEFVPAPLRGIRRESLWESLLRNLCGVFK